MCCIPFYLELSNNLFKTTLNTILSFSPLISGYLHPIKTAASLNPWKAFVWYLCYAMVSGSTEHHNTENFVLNYGLPCLRARSSRTVPLKPLDKDLISVKFLL